MVKNLLICLVAFLALSGDLCQSAYAVHGKRGSIPPLENYRTKKNSGPFGEKYMAPKKKHRPTGYYRSTLTGRTVYGKPNP
jgi:hypothetical protein